MLAHSCLLAHSSSLSPGDPTCLHILPHCLLVIPHACTFLLACSFLLAHLAPSGRRVTLAGAHIHMWQDALCTALRVPLKARKQAHALTCSCNLLQHPLAVTPTRSLFSGKPAPSLTSGGSTCCSPHSYVAGPHSHVACQCAAPLTHMWRVSVLLPSLMCGVSMCCSPHSHVAGQCAAPQGPHAHTPAAGAAPQTQGRCCTACSCTAPPAAVHPPASAAQAHAKHEHIYMC